MAHKVDTLVHGLRKSFALVRTPALRETLDYCTAASPGYQAKIDAGLDPTADDDIMEAMVRTGAVTVYHPTSTCRIGDVVDPLLRVKGIAGLRVIDASVMPHLTSGNTNAPSIMIGEKGKHSGLTVTTRA